MSESARSILIIDAHPDGKSFCKLLADAYEQGARKAGYNVSRLNIRDLSFDVVLHYGYRQEQALEPDLLKAQVLIQQARHTVFVMPVWWGGLPSLFKGFLDRTFIRGFSHSFDPKKGLPLPLLKGRSASVLYTQGAPFLYSWLVTHDGFWKVMKHYILKFCGFSPVKRACFDKISLRSARSRENVLKSVERLGAKGF